MKEFLSDVNVLREKIAHDPKFVSTRDELGQIPLHCACRMETPNLECIQLLIDNRSDVNDRSDEGFAPIHLAIMGEHVDLVKKLVLAGARTDKLCSLHKRTPLHYACLRGLLPLVEYLCEIDEVALVKRDSESATPYDLAVRGGHEVIVKYVQNRPYPQINLFHLFTLIEEYIVQAQLPSSKINARQINALTFELMNHFSVGSEYLDYLGDEKLIDLITASARFNNDQLIDFIVKRYGISVNQRTSAIFGNKLPLQFSVENNSTLGVTSLLRNKANLDFRLDEPRERVKYQAEFDPFCDVNDFDPFDSSTGFINPLTSSKRPLNIQSAAIATAFECLALDSLRAILQVCGTYTMMMSILENRVYRDPKYQELIALVERVQDRHKQYIQYCREGRLNDVKTLLNVYYINIDADDANGRTGLFVAVVDHQIGIVRELTQRGAKIIFDQKVRNPLDVAIENRNLSDDDKMILITLLNKAFDLTLPYDLSSPYEDVVAHMIITDRERCDNFFDQSDNATLKYIGKLAAAINKPISLSPSISMIYSSAEYEKWLLDNKFDERQYYSSDSDSEEDACLQRDSSLPEVPLSQTQERLLTQELSIFYPKEYSRSVTTLKAILERNIKLASNLIDTTVMQKLLGDLQGAHSKTKRTSKKMSKVARANVSEVTKSSPTKYLIATYRGVAYKPRDFNHAARKSHRKRNEVRQPYYSLAMMLEAANTQSIKELEFFLTSATEFELSSYQDRLSKLSGRVLKSHLASQSSKGVKISNDLLISGKEEHLRHVTDRRHQNLNHALLSLYTNAYSLYKTAMRSHFFRNMFMTPESCAISTSQTPYHALKYVYTQNDKNTHASSRSMKRWDSNGRVIFPHLGKIYVFLNTLEDIESSNLPGMMSFKQQIDLSLHIGPEREITYFSMANGTLVYQYIAKFPSFNKPYKPVFLYKYGMTKEHYEMIKQEFTECYRRGTLDEFESRLGEFISGYQESRLVNIAEKIALAQGASLVYLDEFGEVKLDGIPAIHTQRKNNANEESSPVKRKQKRYDQESADEIRMYVTPREDDIVIDSTIFRSDAVRFQILDENKAHLRELESDLLKPFTNSHSALDEEKFYKLEAEYTTIIHYAVIFGFHSFVAWVCNMLILGRKETKHEVLLGLDILNIKDRHKNTPLHLAALVQNVSLYKQLLDAGACSAIANKYGLFPQDILMALDAGITPSVYLNKGLKVVSPLFEPNKTLPASEIRLSQSGKGPAEAVSYESVVKEPSLSFFSRRRKRFDDQVFYNAFNELTNASYEYQTWDIHTILQMIPLPLNTLLAGCLGNGHEILNAETTLKEINQSCLANHTIVGVYNTGGNHWIAFRVRFNQTKDTVFVDYVDSLGAERTDFEDVIRGVFGVGVSVRRSGHKTQNDIVSCGIFAIENMLRLARAVTGSTTVTFYDPTYSRELPIQEKRIEYGLIYAKGILNQIMEQEKEKRASVAAPEESEATREMLRSLLFTSLYYDPRNMSDELRARVNAELNFDVEPEQSQLGNPGPSSV